MTYAEEKGLDLVAGFANYSILAHSEAIAELAKEVQETECGAPVAAAASGAWRSPSGSEYSIYVELFGRVYRVKERKAQTTDFDAIPVYGDDKQLHKDNRLTLAKRVMSHKAADPDKGIVHNMYAVAVYSLCGTVVPRDGKGAEGELRGEAPGREDGVRTIIRERVIEREKEPELEGLLRGFMMDAITKVAVDDMVPRIKQKLIDEFGIEPQRHTVTILDNEVQFDGVVHKMYDTVLHYIANRIPVYMYGPTGTGKGELVKQVAKTLGTGFYAMNSVTDEFKISGFIDANGIYHETEFFRAFTKGGLFFLDEMDASAPEVLVCLNMAIADGYFTFPNGRFEAHEDFRIVAAGNTLGTGADAMYTGRLQLDAASLNRFAVVPVDYDERIDRYVTQGDEELVEFAGQYRKSLKACGLPGACSYRNLTQIKVSQATMSDEQALCFCLTKEMNRDDINTLIGRGMFNEGNRYFKALKKVDSLVG